MTVQGSSARLIARIMSTASPSSVSSSPACRARCRARRCRCRPSRERARPGARAARALVRSLRLGGVDEQQHVEIAIADMTDDRRGHPGALAGRGASPPGIRRAREIGTQTSVMIGLRARPQAAAGVERVVARVPEPRARLGSRAHCISAAPCSAAMAADQLGLFLDGARRAVEFEEQGRQLGIGEPASD